MQSSQNNSFAALSKERGDRYVLTLSLDQLGSALLWPIRWPLNKLWSAVLWLVSALSKIQLPGTALSFTVASVGLGMGLFLSLAGTVLFRPSSTLATPSFYAQERTGPRIVELQVPGRNVIFSLTSSESTEGYFQLPRDTVTHFQFSGRPQESRAVFLGVGYYSQGRTVLTQIDLGDELILAGENNGLYRYRVVATQLRKADKLAASEQIDASLIIAVPQDLFNQEFLVVFAE